MRTIRERPEKSRHSMDGMSIVELLVAMLLFIATFLVLFAAFTNGIYLAAYVQSDADVQNNLRLAMGQMERELRMIGHAVPSRKRIGGTEWWTPSIFHGTPGEIGFRADVDGGKALVTCTPLSTNANCDLARIRVNEVSYFQNPTCDALGGGTGNMKLVVSNPFGRWEATDCTGLDVPNDALLVNTIADDEYPAGASRVSTVEQIYYRYTPSTVPPYGILERAVRYGNLPDDTFPGTGTVWEVLARNLTNFTIDFQNGAGGSLTGNPLTVAERRQARRIVLDVEGYDTVGGQAIERRIRLRSEIFVRNQ